MKLNNQEKDLLIHKLEEAINAPTFESCKEILKEILEEIKNAKNEKQILAALTKLIELLGVLAKAYIGSS